MNNLWLYTLKDIRPSAMVDSAESVTLKFTVYVPEIVGIPLIVHVALLAVA